MSFRNRRNKIENIKENAIFMNIFNIQSIY